jgi:hypothetical protein
MSVSKPGQILFGVSPKTRQNDGINPQMRKLILNWSAVAHAFPAQRYEGQPRGLVPCARVNVVLQLECPGIFLGEMVQRHVEIELPHTRQLVKTKRTDRKCYP